MDNSFHDCYQYVNSLLAQKYYFIIDDLLLINGNNSIINVF